MLLLLHMHLVPLAHFMPAMETVAAATAGGSVKAPLSALPAVS
jgi:hypothetical protein